MAIRMIGIPPSEDIYPSLWKRLMMIAFLDTQVLTTAESNKDLRIDPLQRLHTLTNLSELLVSRVQGIARTLRDDQLQEQAEEIRQASMSQWFRLGLLLHQTL